MHHSSNQKTATALNGLRVLDFSHVYQGPVATQILADYGADVIKVERPHVGDWSRSWGPFVQGVSMPFANLNRNKRSLAINTKTAEGIEIITKLVRSADVLVHNFRSGVMERLGFDYKRMSAINPRLIYASSSGWGDRGPNVDKDRGGHDMMARAESGWFVHYDQDKPPIPGGISVDYPAGLMLLQGILIALLSRESSGLGQELTTDLYSVGFHAHAWEGAAELNKEKIDAPARVGGGEAAIDKAFATRDGYIEISPVFTQNALRDISTAMGLGDLSMQPHYRTESLQMENRSELNALLAEKLKTKNTSEWMEILERADVLCARIQTFAEAANDPQIAANNMVINMEHAKAGSLKVLGTPLRLKGTPPTYRLPPPDLGEHNREVLSELGYTSEQIDQFAADRVFG